MSGKFCAVCLEKNVRWVSLHRFALAVWANCYMDIIEKLRMRRLFSVAFTGTLKGNPAVLQLGLSAEGAEMVAVEGINT